MATFRKYRKATPFNNVKFLHTKTSSIKNRINSGLTVLKPVDNKVAHRIVIPTFQ